MQQCVDNRLLPAISLILATKPEFLPVRQAAPSVQTPTQFFHFRLLSSMKLFKTSKISLLIVCVGNSETPKMPSFLSLSSWSIYRTYVSAMLLFWISVDSSSSNANNFDFSLFQWVAFLYLLPYQISVFQPYHSTVGCLSFYLPQTGLILHCKQPSKKA